MPRLSNIKPLKYFIPTPVINVVIVGTLKQIKVELEAFYTNTRY